MPRPNWSYFCPQPILSPLVAIPWRLPFCQSHTAILLESFRPPFDGHHRIGHSAPLGGVGIKPSCPHATAADLDDIATTR